jgi:outer membrane protein assembly factor BamB
LIPWVVRGLHTQGRSLFWEDHWLYNVSFADPTHGTKFYDGGYPALLSGPYLVTTGWYYRSQAFRIGGERLTRIWDKRTDRDMGLCRVPHGRYGAVLLMDAPNDGPRRLTLFDIVSGRPLWARDLDAEGYAVSAGDWIGVAVGHWTEKRDSNGAVTRERDHRLYLLDARTGRTLWRSRSDLGTPLAASQGRLFTYTGDRLYCLTAEGVSG